MISEGTVTEEIVELKLYGRNRRIDRFIRKLFKSPARVEKAWHVIAKVRKAWPWFERKTRGEVLWSETRRVKREG